MASKFPMSTSRAQSFLCALSESSLASELLEPTIEVLFGATWRNDKPVGKEADLRALCAPIFGTEHSEVLDELLASASTPEGRDRLRVITETSVQSGQFGVPWMVVTRSDGEVANFWGSDRFEQMAAFLGKPYLGPSTGDGSSARL